MSEKNPARTTLIDIQMTLNDNICIVEIQFYKLNFNVISILKLREGEWVTKYR